MRTKCFTYLSYVLLLFVITCRQSPPQKPVLTPVRPIEENWVRQDGEVRWGDTLEKILLRENFSVSQAPSFIAAFGSVLNVRKINAGKTYCLFHDSSGAFQRFDYFAEPELTIQVGFDSSAGWTGCMIRLTLIKKIKSVRGFLNYSLYESMLAMGESPEIIGLFSDVFQWDIDFFSDPQKGDEFRLICEAYHLLDPSQPDSVGNFIRYGRILAGEYIQSDRRFTAVYFQTSAERGGYYDLAGNSFQKTFLKSPLLYGRVTSRFSGARFHPILKIVRAHYAIDIAAPAGTPVSAPADGTVIEKGYNDSIGNFVKIRHKNPHFVTLYGHLSRFGRTIAVGSVVKQRDEIGYVGSTGLSTGPHLHYVFYENNRPINPEKIKNSSGDPMPVALKPAYNLVKGKMLQLLAAAPMRSILMDTVARADTVAIKLQ
jgi:hypothetical protein